LQKGGAGMHSYISGAVIRDLRESRGMTQTELADQIGVSGKAVSKWESGASKLKDTTRKNR